MTQIAPRRFLAAAAALAACLAAHPAAAATPAGQFNVRGTGAMRCEAVAAAFARKDAAATSEIAAWLMGYATAWNRATPGYFDALPTEDGRDFAALVLGSCRSRPALNLEATAAGVLGALRPLALTRESRLVAFTAEGRTLRLREDTVRLVERKLKALGRYTAAETGKATPQLTAAIKAFQTAQKIPASGLPTMVTLIRLNEAK